MNESIFLLPLGIFSDPCHVSPLEMIASPISNGYEIEF